MAKVEAVLKIELDPHNPVNEVMQVIAVLLQNNKGLEESVLNGVSEGIEIMKTRLKGSEVSK